MDEKSFYEQVQTDEELDSYMKNFYMKKKEELGGFATYLSIGTTLYLTIKNGSFFSLKGILFFVIVSFILAPGLLGGIYYVLLRAMTKLTVLLRFPDAFTTLLGFVMFVFQIALGIKLLTLLYGVVFSF